MKLAVIHPALAPYRLDLFNGLAASAEHKFFFLLDNVPNQNFDLQWLRQQLHANHEYRTRGFDFGNYKWRPGLVRAVLREKPDVILTAEFSIETVVFCLLKMLFPRRWKLVTLTDDSLYDVQHMPKWKKQLKSFCFRYLDGLLTASDDVSAAYIARFQLKPEQCAICPVLQSRESLRVKIAAARGEAAAFLEKFGLLGYKILLFVGRLAPEKNLEFQLKIFAAANDPAAKLVLVGSGPDEEAIREAAARLGVADRVVFAGRYDGTPLYAWFWLGQLLLLPSKFERFGAVANEALAAGMPILISDRAGAAIMVHSPRQGAVLPLEDEAGWVHELKARLAAMAPCTQLPTQLPETLQQEDLAQIISQIISFFQNLPFRKERS